MKKYIYLLLFSLPLLAASCSKDNYDEPQETFRGKFIDKQTGEPFQTAIGNTGIRIRMMEYSWSDNPQPYDMNVKMDGTFNNTKVFKGEYGITPSARSCRWKRSGSRFRALSRRLGKSNPCCVWSGSESRW